MDLSQAVSFSVDKWLRLIDRTTVPFASVKQFLLPKIGEKFTETRGLSRRRKLGAGFKLENRAEFAEQRLIVADNLQVQSCRRDIFRQKALNIFKSYGNHNELTKHHKNPSSASIANSCGFSHK